MTAADFLSTLVRINLVSGAAILAVGVLRLPARRWGGARLAYALWLIVPLAAGAAFLPARPEIAVPLPAAGAWMEAAVTTAALPTLPSPDQRFDPSNLLLVIWVAGAAVSCGACFMRQRRFTMLARQNLAGPAVVGFLRPRIVLPADFESRFTPDERAVILAHEATHLAGQDSRINAGIVAVQCALWFNPLIHAAAHFLRVDQELACDAAVIARFPGQRRVYAETLVKTQLATTPLLAGCYWPARAEHPLNRRIAMLKSPSPTVLRRGAGAALIAAAGVGAGFAAWAAQPPRPPQPPVARSVEAAVPPAPPEPPRAAEAEPVRVAVREAAAAPTGDESGPARVFAEMDKRIERDLADRAGGILRTPAPAPEPSTADLMGVAVDQQRQALRMDLAVAQAEADDTHSKFNLGLANSIAVAKTQAQVARARSAIATLDLAYQRYRAIQASPGTRSLGDMDAAERELMRFLSPGFAIAAP